MERFFKICQSIETALNDNGELHAIIYPYGEQGRLFKRILNRYYGIQEEYIIDNSATTDKGVLSISEIKKSDLSNSILFIASDSEKYYNDIRQSAKMLNVKRVYDVFSWSCFYYPDILTIHETLYDDPRYAAMEVAAREIYRNNVRGNVAELGVYRGEFVKHISRCIPDRKFFLFDTFEGFSDRDQSDKDINEIDDWNERKLFADTSVEIALENIGSWVDVDVRKGYFPDTSVGLENEKFCFVSLDPDFYLPTKNGLEFFYPRLNEGGYIFVHDFLIEGPQRAVMEFCIKNQCGYYRVPDSWHTAVIQKPITRIP